MTRGLCAKTKVVLQWDMMNAIGALEHDFSVLKKLFVRRDDYLSTISVIKGLKVRLRDMVDWGEMKLSKKASAEVADMMKSSDDE